MCSRMKGIGIYTIKKKKEEVFLKCIDKKNIIYFTVKKVSPNVLNCSEFSILITS